jgi:hypothetical protein
LIQSNQKSSQQKCFFALGAFALQNGQNLGWNYFAPSHLSPRACKNFLCPAAAQPRIVLPVFARSCSADGFGKRGVFVSRSLFFPIPSLGRGALEVCAKAGRGLMNYLLSEERFSKELHVSYFHNRWGSNVILPILLIQNHLVEATRLARSWPREGLVLFVLKQKVPKNSSHQKCFFALGAFALQNGQNLGWNYFAPRLLSPAHAKTSYACSRTKPALFCPFSPEAVLLTIWGNTTAFVNKYIEHQLLNRTQNNTHLRLGY